MSTASAGQQKTPSIAERLTGGHAPVGALVLAAALLTTLGTSGCGSSDSEANPGAASTAASGKPKPGIPVRPDMVAAVSASKAPGSVDVRFALAGRPVVGQPVDVQFALRPVSELETVYGRFQGGEGLELVKGMETPRFERPEIGADLTHTVTVIPKGDGIFYVTAVVLTDSATDSVSRTYSIPIIAGTGLPELPEAATTRPQSPPPRP